jgi:hypothetical protein
MKRTYQYNFYEMLHGQMYDIRCRERKSNSDDCSFDEVILIL